MKTQGKLKELMRLISAERQNLITGDYEKLDSLSSEQNALLETIQFSDMSDHGIMVLREELEKNTRIIKSALNGFEIAQEKITQIFAIRETSVYNENGSRCTVHRDQSRMERKV